MGGVCDTRNVEINILACEYEIFSLPAEFHSNIIIQIKFIFEK